MIGGSGASPFHSDSAGRGSFLERQGSAWRLRRPRRCRYGPLLRPAIRRNLAVASDRHLTTSRVPCDEALRHSATPTVPSRQRMYAAGRQIRNPKSEIPSALTARCYHNLMDSEQGEDLGDGVFVSPSSRGELIVTSPRLDLGLRVAMGQMPGTAVLWREVFYEVIGRAAAGAGDRWVLRRWQKNSTMWGVVRLDAETVGSMLGIPFGLLAPKKEPIREATVPELRSLDESGGVLELVSPVHRHDWYGDAVLRYRGGFYRLDRTGQEGRLWVYRFRRCSDSAATGPTLRLLPPPGRAYVSPCAESPPPSILRTTLTTAAVTLGPRSDQELWGAHLGVRPIWLTAMGAAAELVGGLVNLRDGLASSGPMMLVLDFFFVGEGLLRLGSVATGRPMGSVFGWILRPLYRRSLLPTQK